MSDDVVGWTLVGKGDGAYAVCLGCMAADEDYAADLFGAADWAVATGRSSCPAAAGEVLAGQPEAGLACVRCGEPLVKGDLELP